MSALWHNSRNSIHNLLVYFANFVLGIVLFLVQILLPKVIRFVIILSSLQKFVRDCSLLGMIERVKIIYMWKVFI